MWISYQPYAWELYEYEYDRSSMISIILVFNITVIGVSTCIMYAKAIISDSEIQAD